MRGMLLLAVVLGAGCGKKGDKAPAPPPEPEPQVAVAEQPKPAPKPPERTTSVFVAVEVEDWDGWKKAFDGQAEARKAAGAIWHSVARDLGDEDRVYVHLVATGADAMRKALEQGGVEGAPEIWVANDVEVDSPTRGRIEGETYSIIGRHKAEDFDAWKQRKQLGVIGGSLSRSADDENVVIFHFMAGDPEKIAEALSGDEAKYVIGQVVEVSMYR